jgi:hypothetical protein
MLDVHPPHERMHGFRDFVLHLVTITIGLLIALGLEGCMEWQHHRHLVHEAEAGLGGEIGRNSKTVAALQKQIKDQQMQLDDDLATLAQMRAHPAASHQQVTFTFAMHSFDDVAWKTAQTTGAFAYMPYDDANTYSNIYGVQDEVVRVEHQAVEDVMSSASFISTQSDNWQPTPAQIDEITDRIGLLRMRLLLLNSIVEALDKTYQKFESTHP